jgi:hypothetical protein
MRPARVDLNRSIDSGDKRLRARDPVCLKMHIVMHVDSEYGAWSGRRNSCPADGDRNQRHDDEEIDAIGFAAAHGSLSKPDANIVDVRHHGPMSTSGP